MPVFCEFCHSSDQPSAIFSIGDLILFTGTSFHQGGPKEKIADTVTSSCAWGIFIFGTLLLTEPFGTINRKLACGMLFSLCVFILVNWEALSLRNFFLRLPLAKLYVNCLLSTLNSRIGLTGVSSNSDYWQISTSGSRPPVGSKNDICSQCWTLRQGELMDQMVTPVTQDWFWYIENLLTRVPVSRSVICLWYGTTWVPVSWTIIALAKWWCCTFYSRFQSLSYPVLNYYLRLSKRYPYDQKGRQHRPEVLDALPGTTTHICIFCWPGIAMVV